VLIPHTCAQTSIWIDAKNLLSAAVPDAWMGSLHFNLAIPDIQVRFASTRPLTLCAEMLMHVCSEPITTATALPCDNTVSVLNRLPQPQHTVDRMFALLPRNLCADPARMCTNINSMATVGWMQRTHCPRQCLMCGWVCFTSTWPSQTSGFALLPPGHEHQAQKCSRVSVLNRSPQPQHHLVTMLRPF
jgi:hypothetical protein